MPPRPNFSTSNIIQHDPLLSGSMGTSPIKGRTIGAAPVMYQPQQQQAQVQQQAAAVQQRVSSLGIKAESPPLMVTEQNPDDVCMCVCMYVRVRICVTQG